MIKESSYKENDKIITILTDELGKVSAVAKGAKKTNSPFLASSQYLVYSEFILYKSNNYYYVNSTSVINMFYKLRIDFDKMETVFELTRLIHKITDENQDTSKILKLFLNTLYIIENIAKEKKLVVSSFKIRLFSLLGFTPRIDKCSKCGQVLSDNDEENVVKELYYDYVSNIFVCEECISKEDKRRYIKISRPTLIAIKYVLTSDIKKMFSFELKDLHDFDLFGQVYTDAITNGI